MLNYRNTTPFEFRLFFLRKFSVQYLGFYPNEKLQASVKSKKKTILLKSRQTNRLIGRPQLSLESKLFCIKLYEYKFEIELRACKTYVTLKYWEHDSRNSSEF